MYGKCHQMAKDSKTKPNKNNGHKRVEEKASRSVDQIYMRMVANGELNTATKLKSNALSKERAQLMLKKPNLPPNYMKDSELLDLRNKMRLLEKSLKNNKIKKSIEEKNKKIREKAVEDYKKSADKVPINNEPKEPKQGVLNNG